MAYTGIASQFAVASHPKLVFFDGALGIWRSRAVGLRFDVQDLEGWAIVDFIRSIGSVCLGI